MLSKYSFTKQTDTFIQHGVLNDSLQIKRAIFLSLGATQLLQFVNTLKKTRRPNVLAQFAPYDVGLLTMKKIELSTNNNVFK